MPACDPVCVRREQPLKGEPWQFECLLDGCSKETTSVSHPEDD